MDSGRINNMANKLTVVITVRRIELSSFFGREGGGTIWCWFNGDIWHIYLRCRVFRSVGKALFDWVWRWGQLESRSCVPLERGLVLVHDHKQDMQSDTRRKGGVCTVSQPSLWNHIFDQKTDKSRQIWKIPKTAPHNNVVQLSRKGFVDLRVALNCVMLELIQFDSQWNGGFGERKCRSAMVSFYGSS